MSNGTVARMIQGWLGHAAWDSLAALKNAVVSDTPHFVKARFGPARGAVLYTSYRHGARMIFGFYEREVVPYLRRYVRSGDVCYDIGAAGGYFAFACARLAAPGRVYCFDIDEQAAKHLNIAATCNAHLGSVVSAHRMRVDASHINETHTSVDALVFERGWRHPNVIKLDAEGDELNVLHGAARVLREYHPRLIIEVHSVALEMGCQYLLQRLGYEVTVVENQAFMAENAFRGGGHNRWICGECPTDPGRGPMMRGATR